MIVADTSPLLALARLNLLKLLQVLAGPTLIPPAVLLESTVRRPDAPGADVIRSAVASGLLQVVEPTTKLVGLSMPTWLGEGETEAILLAIEVRSEWIMLDDRAARRFASNLDLAVVGTVGMLEMAREAGLVPLVVPLLLELRSGGFRISDAILESARLAETS